VIGSTADPIRRPIVRADFSEMASVHYRDTDIWNLAVLQAAVINRGY
jgi:hypothetical protein